MKIQVTSLTEKAVEERDYREMLEIKIDGKRVFRVFDGEPEDATLGRDFNDCWRIIDLMKLSHKAGLTGEPFEIETLEVDEF